MIRSIIFFTLLWISLILSLLLFIPWLLLFFSGMRWRKNWVAFWTRQWAGMVLWLAGTKVRLSGRENIPVYPDFIVISNHQGNMDIPVLMHVFPYSLSFIAKKELLWVPFVNFWLLALNSVMIDRSKPLEAYHRIQASLSSPRRNPLILFPEGTRSRKSPEGTFRKGGMKLAADSGKKIIRVEISGTYRIWEEEKRIRPAEIEVKILNTAAGESPF